MFNDDDSPFLTIDETAELLRVKRRTLDNLRWSGEGPPARRHGGRIVYHRDEVLDWSERRRTRTPPVEDASKTLPPPDGNGGVRHPGDGEPATELSTPPLERKP